MCPYPTLNLQQLECQLTDGGLAAHSQVVSFREAGPAAQGLLAEAANITELGACENGVSDFCD